MTVNISKPSINIREKLSELDKPSGIAGEAVLRADSVQEIRNSIGAGRKNLIINGGFDVWQRGTYTTATNVSSGFQSDRWKIAQSATTGTIQDLGGSVRLEVTGAGTGTLRMYQPIEDKGLYKRISGKTLTFSAWVKSNTANARIECFKGNGVGWDGWDSAHTGGGAWEKLSATYVLADISSLTDGAFSVQVGLDGYNSADVALAVGDYCEIKDVQLELGSVATDFEHRSYGEELALCQRYFRVLDWATLPYSVIGATNSAHHVYGLSYSQMRAPPTLTHKSGTFRIYSNASSGDVASLAGSNTNLEGFRLYVNKISASFEETWWDSGNTSNAIVLHLDAEL